MPDQDETESVGTMEDLKKLEEVVRRIAREEITRALGAVGAVAEGAMEDTGGSADVARGVLAGVMERVARDVLADKHPVLDTEHASTETVHTITAVPERARPVCTGCEHPVHETGKCAQPVLEMRRGGSSMTCRCTRNMGASTSACTWCRHTEHGGHIGHKCACGCTGPKPEHTSTEAPRTCSSCLHDEHDQGRCGWPAYLRGVASPCPCLASRTLGAQPSTSPNPMCTVCEHAPHGAGNCEQTIPYGEAAFQCTCGGRS